MQINADFPEKLQQLFSPSRYKVAYGGRGAGRSWGFARALLLKGTQRPLRILCAREFQNSISDSVHKLLSDQIQALGLSSFYSVLQSRIEGANGTYFAFEGIKNNVGRIKSYEAIDICWVEEADKTSRNSWGVLIPTIRKPDSEIWMSFNPSLETDYTYKRFVKEADDSMIIIRMTYADNPFFPQVLRDEMERDRERDYDYYLNVWEGHCVQHLEGAIYAKELRKAQEDGRICRVPYDPSVPVTTWWDLGRADYTAIWFGQRVGMQDRLINYYEDKFVGDITYYIKRMQALGYVYGDVWLPHDAKAKRLGMQHTIQGLVRNLGFNARITPGIGIVDGINAARMSFANTWFDETNTADGLQRLRHYRYKIIDGKISDKPDHDGSDGPDAFRYRAVSQRQPTSSAGVIKQRLADAKAALLGELDKGDEFSGRSSNNSSRLGWMG